MSVAATDAHQRQTGIDPVLGLRHGNRFIDDEHGCRPVRPGARHSRAGRVLAHAGAGVAQVVAPVLLALRAAAPEQAFDALQVGAGLRQVARMPDHAQWQQHEDGRAAALGAFEREVSAHQGDELPADRQPESGAAEAARGRGLGLGEGLEQACLVLRADADAVVRYLQPQGFLPDVLDAQRDTAVRQRFRRELDGIAEQVVQDLAQPHRIADDLERQGRRDVEVEHDVVVMRHRTERIADAFGQLFDLQRCRVDFHVTGLDLGQVEDVVDDAQQAQRRVPDRHGQCLLFGRQPGLEQDFGRADDAVHRRAHLVAHRGQEVGLGLVGALGGELGQPELERALGDHFLQVRAVPFEFVGDALALGDVVVDRGVVRDLAVGVAQRAQHRRDRVLGAVLAPVVEFALAGLAGAQRIPHLDVLLGRGTTRADQIGVAVQHFLAAVARVLHEGLVDIFDRRVEIRDDDGLRALFDHLRQHLEPGFEDLALADVGRVGHAHRRLALFVEQRADLQPDREAVAILAHIGDLERALPVAVDLAQLRGEQLVLLGRADRGDLLALEFFRAPAMLAREVLVDHDETVGPGAADCQTELGLLEQLSPVRFDEHGVDNVCLVGDGIVFQSEALCGTCAESWGANLTGDGFRAGQFGSVVVRVAPATSSARGPACLRRARHSRRAACVPDG